MPSELERTLARYRRAILDRDLLAQRRLLASYGAAMDRLLPLIELAQQEIDAGLASRKDLRINGEWVRDSVFQMERYRILEGQIRREMDELAQQTGTVVRGGQAEAIELGHQAALDLALASAADPVTLAGSFASVPRDAIIDLVGALDPDGPTGKLLQSFGDEAVSAVRDALVSEAALGQSPRLVAQAVRRATGMSATRALTISRTEMLRSYRTAKLARYAANADILDGWVWTAAKQRRTCAACLALDGEVFPLSRTFFPSHVNCRCTARPKLQDRYAAKRTPPETGEAWLRRQDVDVQDDILGRQGGAAFRAGEVELGDFVRTDDHPVWGESRRDGGIGWARTRAARRARKEAMRKPPEPPVSADPIQRAFDALPGEVDKSDRDAFTKQRQEFWESLGATPKRRPDGSFEPAEIARQAIEGYVHPWSTLNYQAIRGAMTDLARDGKVGLLYRPVEQHARFLLRTIADSPPIDRPLYRGSFTRGKDRPASLGAPGDTIRLPGSASFSLRKDVADGFREGTVAGAGTHEKKAPNHETTIIVQPGAKGIKVDQLSDWDQAEVITGGEFEIVSVETVEGKRKNGKTYVHTTYTVKHTAVVDIDQR